MSLPNSEGGTAVGATSFDRIAERDLYGALNVSRNADATEIRLAYRRAVLSAHPDKGGTSEAFHSITAAFNVLSCPTARCLYEKEHDKQKQESQDVKKRGQKRRCDSATKESRIVSDSNAASHPNATCTSLAHSLQCLRAVLQHTDKASRNTFISSMPLRVQSALIDFMKKTPENAAQLLECAEGNSQRMGSGCTRLGTSGTRSNAQLDIEYLRIYTRLVDLESAIEQQLLLAKVRERMIVASADKEFWNRSQNVCHIFGSVLAEHNTSIDELGLSVYVEMRAPEWIANSHRITSPVTTLEEAVTLRSRFLHARSTSWELLRAAWIDVMQRGKYSRSLEDSETRADQARQSFLEQRRARAVQSVERSLDRQDRKLASKVKRCAEKDATQNLAPLKRQRRTSESEREHPYLSMRRLRAHTTAFAGVERWGIRSSL